MSQKHWQTHMYWLYTHKLAQSIPTQQIFEIALSEIHILTVTELKMRFQKLKSKIIAYRDYKKFDNARFRYDIVTAAFNVEISVCKKVLFPLYLIVMSL